MVGEARFPHLGYSSSVVVGFVVFPWLKLGSRNFINVRVKKKVSNEWERLSNTE